MDIFLKHQLKIARDTLKLHDAAVSIMGGMTKQEAREILAKHRNTARKEREGALRDCGLIKVRGAMGGTYWE